jgi:hypothetical protein
VSGKNAAESSLRSKVQQRRAELASAPKGIGGVSTWLVGAALVLAAASLIVLSVIGNGSVYAGISGSGWLAWLAFGVTTIYVLATGRPSWMRLNSGRRSAIWPAIYSAAGYTLSGIMMAALSA